MPPVTEAVDQSCDLRTSLSSSSRRMFLNSRLTVSAPDLHAPPVATTSPSPAGERPVSSRSVPVRRNSLPEQSGGEIQYNISSTHDRLDRSTEHGSARSWTEVHPLSSAPPNLGSPPTDLIQLVERLEQIRRERNRRRHNRTSIRGLWNGVNGFFGYGPEGSLARRELVSLITKLVFGMGQIAAVISLLILGSQSESPKMPGVNEWDACNKPLGPWSVIWAVRVVFGGAIAIWTYMTRPGRRRANRPPSATTHNLPTSDDYDGTELPEGSLRLQPADPRPPTPLPTAPRRNTIPARLGSLLSIISTCWFIVAHILVYTTVHSCRLSAPHIWWLTFGIICIGYLVILELVAVVFVVFVLIPLCIVLINVVLVCMGREPIQYPSRSQHEIGKMSTKAVDRIPLVLYIPAPVPKQGREPSENEIISSPEAAHLHSYPPQPERRLATPTSSQGTRVQSRSRRWFTFRRLRRKRSFANVSKGKNGTFLTDEYEDKWEKGDYPFVKLEDNRATCAICLCDFEEPKRMRYSLDSRPPDTAPEEKPTSSNVDVEQGQAEGEEADGELRLENPGEGAQPLRLLGCAHVFHKTCIDPWLTEVSGRCPVCQRPVEVNHTSKKKHRRVS